MWFKKAVEPARRIQEFPQFAGKNGPRPRPQMPNFRQILDLTPEQDAKFKEIIGESRKQMTEFRIQTEEFHAQQDEKIRAVMDEMNRKLNAILDENQRKKFAAWQKEFESRRRPPRRRDFPPPPSE